MGREGIPSWLASDDEPWKRLGILNQFGVFSKVDQDPAVSEVYEIPEKIIVPVEFKDYYATIGVSKSATQEEIKKAFRDLARKHHPDLAKPGNKASSEERFKEINEAYEVLKDPDKRKKYDRLGSDWDKYDDDFFDRQTAGGARGFGGFSNNANESGRGFEYHFGGTGFSDFFERYFGGAGVDPINDMNRRGQGGFAGRSSAHRRPVRGADVEADLLVTLEEAFNGSTRRISLRKIDPANGTEKIQDINVKIPAGVRESQRIRLGGQGQPSPNDGVAGDLYLKTRFAQHPLFVVKDSDLLYSLNLAPWEAALGCVVDVPTLHGTARVTVKSGTQANQQLRLPKHGLPKQGGKRGDLLAEVHIEMPRSISTEEKELWEKLQKASNFNPRSKQ